MTEVHLSFGNICPAHGGHFRTPFSSWKILLHYSFNFRGDYNEILITPGNFYEQGGFKYTPGKEKYYTHEYPSEYLCFKGDLVVAMTEQTDGLLGSTALVPENNKFLHNQRIGLITFDSDIYNRLFLYYVFRTKNVRAQIAQSSSGSKVKHTSPKRIYDVKIQKPPLNEQVKIGALLYSIDKKIKLNNKINTELEAMAKLIYDYWFVQFDFPDASGKPYKSSGGKMVYNETLKREIPDGWEVSSIGEYAAVKKGELITKKTVRDGCVKVVAAGIKFSYYHSTENYKKNTITISGSGASAGFVNFWREPIFASDCITVRGSTDSETLLILHYLNLIQDYIFKQARGSAQPHVYPADISVLNLSIPPKNIIVMFGGAVLCGNKKIAINDIENEKLRELRDWLLPMLMNGQVTVKDVS